MDQHLPTRRSLLGTATLLGAGAFQRMQGANDRVNLGIIGVGMRGHYMLKLALTRAREVADVQIVAVCDVYQKRLNRAVQEAAGAKAYVNHQELLDHPGLDAVLVATPDHWHAAITLAAMRHGKDVYCEKPITHTVEEALLVLHEARERKRVLQVGVQANSWSKWHKAKDAIADGMLGQIVSCHGTYSRNRPDGDWNYPIDPDAGPEGKGEARIEWKQWLGPAPERPFDADRFFRFRKYWDYSGGIATDLHYHTVAPFHLAVKNDFPTRVAGMGGLWMQHDGREVPDTFLNAADYPGRYQILVQSSQNNANGPATMIRGQRATMTLGEDWEGQRRDTITIVPEKPFAADFKKKWGQDQLVITGAGQESDSKHLDNFFDCVRSRQEPNCGPDLAAKVMAHIGLAVRSYREGKMFYFDAAERRALDHPEA